MSKWCSYGLKRVNHKVFRYATAVWQRCDMRFFITYFILVLPHYNTTGLFQKLWKKEDRAEKNNSGVTE